MDEYERMLHVMQNTIGEHWPNSVQLIHDVEQLLHIIHQKIEALVQVYDENNYRGEMQLPSVNLDNQCFGLRTEI